ncbi:hypothetical protein LU604_04360 [Erwinia tracheiphila]|uniref:Uncharacterized protein n=1 Tax=Erwinia tracheiphila TaxID=65700 RepID=A0A345CUB3_9GAMM|nr:hypothetical protein [Erwinia tracheiphila]AXF77030.1 hypothetical protein AV903_14990 [Erwinia tracheiphila]UIA84283.1 hypothetical protein LU604_04360 [Erwinia tracheiphila]UIA92864.1 hypothetical protein LU632_04315 [Erwinia tracheiphila]
MKQKPAKCGTDEFGYLVSTDEFRFQPPGKLYCFYCSCPMVLVRVQGNREAHFLHDIAMLVSGDIVCPNIERV